MEAGSCAQQAPWDVLIAGGGMAGLCLARQLRLEMPQLRVAIVERTRRPIEDACHKVGESNAELGSQYLERLGLAEYLRSEHIVKLGLRFFPGGGARPIESRTELGPALEPIVRGYQIDRGRFEQDLRGMVELDGTTLWEGEMVRGLELGQGDEPHRVVVERGGTKREVTARWFVDATGRAAMLRRRFASKLDNHHVASAGWFRVEGRIHLHELRRDPQAESAWGSVPLADQRWRSTSHLMGEGYWVWIIALRGNRTSLGVVVHDDEHGFERVRTYQHVLEFLHEQEPDLAARLERAEVLDFACMRRYSHGIEQAWSEDRWAIVGDAGAFVDPLYSPGTDFIALSNSFTVELIGARQRGQDPRATASRLNAQYAALIEGSLGVYRQAAAVYAHPRALAAKVYWDNFAYWSYTCQYFVQGLFRIAGEFEASVNRVRARFVELSGYVQTLARVWATLQPEEPRGGFVTMPPFPSFAVDAHLDLEKTFAAEETLDLMRRRVGQGERMVAELVVRLLLEYGPQQGRRILDEAGGWDFDLPYDPSRLENEATVGLARRRALTREVRDVERALGRLDRHPQWQDALRLLPAVR